VFPGAGDTGDDAAPPGSGNVSTFATFGKFAKFTKFGAGTPAQENPGWAGR
jgi:hypothetical protein